jgi:thiol-disulfide isomerase/thioredoxin
VILLFWQKALSLMMGLALAGSAPSPNHGVEPPKDPPKVNKLLYMYDLYYLPFSLFFREGKTINDIIPYIKSGDDLRVVKAAELQSLDSEWNTLRISMKNKSLLQNTPVPVNQSVWLTPHLASHHISFDRTAFDSLPLPERIRLAATLKNKSPEVQASYRQLRFLRSFLGANGESQFNFFIISASWCESCREYRILLESYLKEFPKSGTTLHSVVIEDEKENIFDSLILKELFPHPKKYSHDSIPRFLALEFVAGQPKLLEEGEALKALYERVLREHQGYYDSQTTLFHRPAPAGRSLSSVQK